MKGDSCGFLHQFDRDRMPTCRTMVRRGVCTEPDCPFKHTTEDIKECNMYRLGFCVYGPTCRYKHTRLPGPPPDPTVVEAAKPREHRNVNAVVNSVNVAITASRTERHKLLKERAAAEGGMIEGAGRGGGAPALPAPPPRG
jgi:cleavage and polyadenylation specificity factor subunit 4